MSGVDRRRRTLLQSALLGLGPALDVSPARADDERTAAPLPALNLARGEYFNAVFPFANLVRSSGPGWNPDTWSDPAGWLRDLPPGKETFCWVVLHLDPVHGTFAPGEYVASSSSPATLSLVTLSPALVEAGRGEPGRVAFTVKRRDDGDYTSLSIGIRCRNETDRPIDVADLALHGPAGAGGPTASEFHPAWLASNRGASLLRAMDWAAINNSAVTRQRDLPAAGDRSWSRGVPYLVQARAAAALKADLWVCVPHGGQNLQYVCSAATGRIATVSGGQPRRHGLAEDAPVVFVDYSQGRAGLPPPLEYGRTYHAVHCRDADFQVAEAPGGRPLALGADVGPANFSRVSSALGIEGLSTLYEAIARQVEAGLHRGALVHVEYSNEVWNFSFQQSHFVRQYMARLGATPGVPASGYGVGSLLAWRAFEKVLGRERVRRVFCAQSAWFENLAPALDYVDRGLLANGTPVARLADVYAIAPYAIPHDEQRHAHGIRSLLDAGAERWTDTQWDAAFDRHLEALDTEVATHLAKARARGPRLAFTSYECGQHVGEAVPRDVDPSRARALQRRYLDYLDGPKGAAMYRRYHDRVFARHGLRHFNHFTDVGGYASSRFLFQWGLKPSHLSPETPRGAFFRSLPLPDRR